MGVEHNPNIKLIKDWKIPASGIRVYRSEGHKLCVVDFNEDKTYAINEHYPMIAVYRRRNAIPRTKYERIFGTQTELEQYFDRVRDIAL